MRHIELGVIAVCLLGVLTGCATAPAAERDTSRADDAMQDGNVEKALYFYVRALEFNPEDVAQLANIGEIQMQRMDYAKAKKAFLLVKEYAPSHSGCLESLGLIYAAEGLDEQAVNELQAAVFYNDRLWRAHNALGVYADKSGNFLAAQDHYDAALSVNAGEGFILNNRGYSKFLAGDYQGATSDLYEAAAERGFQQAWVSLGLVYATQGWYEDAVATYQNVMSDAHAYNNAGEIALQNGEAAEASRFLNEAIMRSPVYFPRAERNLQLLEKLN